MFKYNLLFYVAITAFLLAGSGVAVAEETFRSSEFLQYPEDGQRNYIRASISMTGLIAAQNDKKHADCIDQWYFSDIAKRNKTIRETMRQNPDFHPQAVILAVLQKACGSFSYKKK